MASSVQNLESVKLSFLSAVFLRQMSIAFKNYFFLSPRPECIIAYLRDFAFWGPFSQC